MGTCSGCSALGKGGTNSCPDCSQNCGAACLENCSGDCLTACGNWICGGNCAGLCQSTSELEYACKGCQESCGNGCGNKCVGGCREECGNSCTGSSECTCGSNCKGDCEGDCDGGCYNSCSGSCKGTCKNTCNNTCLGNCDTDCSSSSVISAYEKLKNLDLSQVMIGDEIDALEDMVMHEMTLRNLTSSIASQKDQGTIANKITPQMIYNDLNKMKAYPRSGDYASVQLESNINNVTQSDLIKNYIKVVLSLYEVVIPQK